MTRGSPSRPLYAIRAGSGPLSSCCAYGLARISVISSFVMMVILSSRSSSHQEAKPAPVSRHRSVDESWTLEGAPDTSRRQLRTRAERLAQVVPQVLDVFD